MVAVQAEVPEGSVSADVSDFNKEGERVPNVKQSK